MGLEDASRSSTMHACIFQFFLLEGNKTETRLDQRVLIIPAKVNLFPMKFRVEFICFAHALWWNKCMRVCTILDSVAYLEGIYLSICISFKKRSLSYLAVILLLHMVAVKKMCSFTWRIPSPNFWPTSDSIDADRCHRVYLTIPDREAFTWQNHSSVPSDLTADEVMCHSMLLSSNSSEFVLEEIAQETVIVQLFYSYSASEVSVFVPCYFCWCNRSYFFGNHPFQRDIFPLEITIFSNRHF